MSYGEVSCKHYGEDCKASGHPTECTVHCPGWEWDGETRPNVPQEEIHKMLEALNPDICPNCHVLPTRWRTRQKGKSYICRKCGFQRLIWEN